MTCDVETQTGGAAEDVPLSHHFLPAIICVNIMNHKQNCLPQENIDIKTCIHPAAALQSSNMYSSSSPNIKQKQRLRWNLLLHETCIVHFTPNQNNYSCYNMLEMFSLCGAEPGLIMICTKERKVDVTIGARIIR